MRVRIAADVGVVDADDAIYVATLPDGPILVLSEEAAVTWRAASGAIPADRADERYVSALVDAGLLTIDKEC